MHAYVHIRRALLYYVNMYVQLVTLRKLKIHPISSWRILVSEDTVYAFTQPNHSTEATPF